MSTITKIVMPCTDDTMGDTSPADCNAYRVWLAEQLRSEYPGAIVTVTSRPGRIEITADGDDSELINELHEFQNRCWDCCPWDFV